MPVLFDPIEANRDHPLFVGDQRPILEGGDVLVLSSDVIAVGVSERTNRIGVKHLARALARTEGGRIAARMWAHCPGASFRV